jgi:hypothetical protein
MTSFCQALQGDSASTAVALDNATRHRATRWVLVLAAHALVTVVMLSPIVDYRHLGTASYPGDVRLITWTMAWNNHAVLNGLPLFEANVFFPAANSLAYNEHLFGVSLFALPIYALTRNPVLGYNLLLICAFVLKGVCAHQLTHRYLKDHLAAFVAGVVYSFSFYNMLHGHGHLHLVWTFLIPLSLLGLERWHRRPTWPRLALWLAATLLQILSSWYLAVMVVAANGLLLVFLTAASVGSSAGSDGRVTSTRPEPGASTWPRRVIQLVVAAFVCGLFTWTFARHYGVVAAGGLSEAAMYSADTTAYLLPPLNTWLGQWIAAHTQFRPRSAYGESSVYLGWVAMAFAAIGSWATLVPAARRRTFPALGVLPSLYAATLGVLALPLSFGPSPEAVNGGSPWMPFDLFQLLPGMTLLRAPARFAVLVLLALGWLAAAGAAALHVKWGLRGRAVTVLAIPLMLSEWYLVGFSIGKPVPEEIPAVYKHLATLPPGPLVSLPDYSRDPTFWWLGGDYLLYSTAHWFPIVNGFGRSEPKDHGWIIGHMKAFAGPNSARTMRRLGVRYVVLHSGRYPDRAVAILEEGLHSPDFALMARFGPDYLFKVLDRSPVADQQKPVAIPSPWVSTATSPAPAAGSTGS